MGMYRVDWECCGDSTITDAWQPEECPFCQIAALQQQVSDAQARIKELAQGDPAWYDMSEADAFRMWAEDRKKLAELEQRLKDTPA